MRIDWVDLFTSGHGRISRSTFWIGCLVLALVETAAQLLADHIQGDRLSAVVDLAFTYPEFMLTVKRAFDRNLPAWLIGLFYAGDVFLSFLGLLGIRIDLGDPIVVLTLFPWSAFALVLLIELGFRRGTAGPNRFGPDPLANEVA
jgi:uncharacterized membrane protein YhaH (DUF805 family)